MKKENKDYLIVCDTMTRADKLMNDFIYKLHENDEVKQVSRVSHSVITTNNDRYRFCSLRVADDLSRGSRCEIISGLTFEVMVDKWSGPSFIRKIFIKVKRQMIKFKKFIFERK